MYKVTTGELRSAAVRDDLAVQYKVGEWVSANVQGSPLFVFADWILAVTYARRAPIDYKIFRCEVRGACNQINTVPILPAQWSDIVLFKVCYQHGAPIAGACRTPIGSFAVEEVKLIEELSRAWKD